MTCVLALQPRSRISSIYPLSSLPETAYVWMVSLRYSISGVSSNDREFNVCRSSMRGRLRSCRTSTLRRNVPSLRRKSRLSEMKPVTKPRVCLVGGDRVLYDLLLMVAIADTLEILLLLLWRHLQYYTEARPAESQIQVSTPHITRLVTSMDVESFRAEVPRRLGALLQRLDTLDMVIIIYVTLHARADMDLL